MGELDPRYRRVSHHEALADISALHPLVTQAPPAALQVWTMPGLEPGRPVTTGPARPGDLDEEVRARLADHGYTGTLATNTDQEFVAPVRVGNRLRVEDVYVSITDEKQTALGPGFFITTRATYRRADEPGVDEVVGHLYLTVFNFRPAAVQAVADVLPPREQFRSEHGKSAAMIAGGELGPVRISVTTTLIVSGAFATSDFYPVHHDRDFARSHGNADIVMNIQTTNGLFARIAGEWCGPADLLRLRTRLRSPAYPHDELSFTGTVLSVKDGEVRFGMRALLDEGAHAEAEAVLRPRRG